MYLPIALRFWPVRFSAMNDTFATFIPGREDPSMPKLEITYCAQ